MSIVLKIGGPPPKRRFESGDVYSLDAGWRGSAYYYRLVVSLSDGEFILANLPQGDMTVLPCKRKEMQATLDGNEYAYVGRMTIEVSDV